MSTTTPAITDAPVRIDTPRRGGTARAARKALTSRVASVVAIASPSRAMTGIISRRRKIRAGADSRRPRGSAPMVVDQNRMAVTR